MKEIFKKNVAKTDIKPELQGVFITKEKMAVTDSFVLLEVDHSIFTDEDKMKINVITSRFNKNTSIKPDDLDLRVEILNSMPIEDSVSFPDYTQLFPNDEKLNSDYISIKVNPTKLGNICLSIAKTFSKRSYEGVTIYLPKSFNQEGKAMNGKPLIIKRDDGKVTGLVMPLNR